MPEWKKSYEGVEEMTVAVMGCVVNGPGESKMANLGISLPGTGEVPVAPVFEALSDPARSTRFILMKLIIQIIFQEY